MTDGHFYGIPQRAQRTRPRKIFQIAVSKVAGHLQGHQQETGAAAMDRKDFV